MRTDPALIDRVLALIDQDELVRLACDIVSIPSLTGNEKGVSTHIHQWLERQGLEAIHQEIETDRYNVIGMLPGTGGGMALMYNGHMDTSLSGGAEDAIFGAGAKAEFQAKAVIDGGLIRGSGIVNDKGPLACALIALKAVKDAGVRLPGDVMVAGVAGEIGRAPVDEYQGAAYRGKGVGTRYLLTHGIVSDWAIVVEPSQLRITWAQPGAVFAKVTTWGVPKYAPHVQHGGPPEKSENAVVKMGVVMDALERWAAEYEVRHRYEFKGGVMVPKANIGAIAGGAPFKPNFSPGVCKLYLEAFIAPPQKPIDVKREIEAVVKSTGVDAKVELYLSVRGYESQGAEELVATAEGVWERVTGRKPQPIRPGFTSTYADLTIYAEMGIPVIKWGPSPDDPSILPGTGEVQKIEDMVTAAKLYALSTLEICSRPAP